MRREDLRHAVRLKNKGEIRVAVVFLHGADAFAQQRRLLGLRGGRRGELLFLAVNEFLINGDLLFNERDRLPVKRDLLIDAALRNTISVWFSVSPCMTCSCSMSCSSSCARFSASRSRSVSSTACAGRTVMTSESIMMTASTMQITEKTVFCNLLRFIGSFDPVRENQQFQ